MKVGTIVSSPWRYLAEARVDRKGVEESWEEMVSWLSWLFELVYLKRASSASTLTWCCSCLWHIFILSDWHTHAWSHIQSHKDTCARTPSSPSSNLPAASDTAPMILSLEGSELSDWQGMRRLTCDTVRQDQMCHPLLEQRSKEMRDCC